MKTGLMFVSPEKPVILILGSLPGDASIAAGQYYAHPQNHFWQIAAKLTGAEMPLNYESRLEILKQHGAAVWDVLHSAERQGSLDSKIKSPQSNDLRAFIKAHGSLKLIVLNGKKAQACFLKYFPDIDIPHVCVRSSSPVASQSCNTAAEKAEQWAAEISRYISLPLPKL